MSDTLRDQLLGLGFKPAPAPAKPASAPGSGPRQPKPRSQRDPAGHRGPADGKAPHRSTGRASPRDANAGARDGTRPASGKEHPAARGRRADQGGGARTREDIDLAKAYAIRAQREKDERIAAEKAKQEDARLRREAKAKLAALLKDQALNDPAAEIARHFDYGGKIKRIHVNAAQLKALNAGELGVVQLDGRYLLVSATILAAAESTFAPAVALKVDPSAPASEDPYADPAYRVPDDLVW